MASRLGDPDHGPQPREQEIRCTTRCGRTTWNVDGVCDVCFAAVAYEHEPNSAEARSDFRVWDAIGRMRLTAEERRRGFAGVAACHEALHGAAS